MFFFFFVFSITAIAQSYDVTNFGAVGDGKTLNTLAIQKAIDECNSKGGGSVYFPAGKFVSGTIQLKSNVIFISKTERCCSARQI
jgi:polygalacturonase